MPRPRQPRYVLSTYMDGKRMFLQHVERRPACKTTYHWSLSVGNAMHLTKYMADKLRLELSDPGGEYQAEPLNAEA